MATQSLLWTALPNGLTGDGGLRVSVMLVPRLDPEADPPRLDTFREWLDWPATLADATFHVTYGATTVAVAATQTTGPDRVDTRLLGTADSSVWTALFAADLLVRGGAYRDHTSDSVVSYETTDMADLVADVYGALAADPGDDLPTVTDLLTNAGLERLVGALDQLDRVFTDESTGLRDSARQFDRYRKTRLRELEGVPGTLARAELFHTPPSTQRAVTQTRADDSRIEATYRSHEQTELPAPEDFAKRLDFHQILAAMNSYPTVLRKLGVVVDLVLAADQFAVSSDELLSVAVTFSPNALSVPRAPDVSPSTHAALSDSAFVAIPAPTPPTATARVVDGLLDLDPSRFDLLQVDVDAAGLKVMNFARSLGRLAHGDRRVDSVSRMEKPLGAPSLRTAGMMLVHRDRGQALEARFARTAAANEQAQSVIDADPGAVAPELWAEDLVRGFRFDIWDATTDVWRSLCRRTATYRVGRAVTVEPLAGEEEGAVRLAATRSPDEKANQDLVWLHEAVVSWTGWSLTAPPPGRAINPDDGVGTEARTEAEIPPGLEFASEYRAVTGSLPRLRFGREYWLRARAVDLAGNSLAPQEHDFGPEDPRSNARPFLRYEPVAAPVAALVRSAGTTEHPAEGESMYRIAIRSFNDTPADNLVPTRQTARRFAVPQQVSAREAEQHGMLDSGGIVDATTFAMLATQKDHSADEAAAALVQEVIPMKGPLDDAAVNTTFAVYKDGAALTYLPDPLAEEVAIRIAGIPGVDPEEVMTITLYPAGAWPEAQPFKVELVEHPGDPPSFDAASRTLRVPLDKGDRALLRMSMKLSGQALGEVMGVWRWVSSPTPELERRAREGQHWMLTPWHTLELVHAVQRPLRDPEFVNLMIDRSAGETSALPRFRAAVSIKSTDRLDLLAEWHEPDDLAPTAQVDRIRRDTAFSLKVTSEAEYEPKSAENPRGGDPDHRISGPDEIDVGMEWRGTKSHEFHDTRYRRIEYWLQATTKFREYLPASIAGDEEKLGTVGPSRVAWIPSSSPPPAPEVLYVVPTFGWSRSREEDGEVASHRRGGGLRVYLDRPWNVSGYGEMLAVVLAPPSFKGEPESEPRGHAYKTRVTQWGNDPIWRSPFVKGFAPSRSSFPRARTAPDPAGGWLPANAPATEADQPPGEFDVTGLGPWEAPLEIAPHDVFYDTERELWYCDLEVDQGGSYWPMIRLALARYQPVSVYGAELSEVVLADFMPLTADRWLNVRPRDGEVHVSVFGTTFSDSSGHQEAAGAPSFSTYDRLTGRAHTYEPADVSATTVVEVWIEALDPAKGEDFGWERVDAQVLTGEEDRPRGRFEPALRHGLAGHVANLFGLWEGRLRPPRGLDRRLRLVVAEYEEYPVDDEAPYDRVPEQKGRRLVFVEHVELD